MTPSDWNALPRYITQEPGIRSGRNVRPKMHNAAGRNIVARRRWYFCGRVLKSRQAKSG
jgi:hypothetical protein